MLAPPMCRWHMAVYVLCIDPSKEQNALGQFYCKIQTSYFCFGKSIEMFLYCHLQRWIDSASCNHLLSFKVYFQTILLHQWNQKQCFSSSCVSTQMFRLNYFHACQQFPFKFFGIPFMYVFFFLKLRALKTSLMWFVGFDAQSQVLQAATQTSCFRTLKTINNLQRKVKSTVSSPANEISVVVLTSLKNLHRTRSRNRVLAPPCNDCDATSTYWQGHCRRSVNTITYPPTRLIRQKIEARARRHSKEWCKTSFILVFFKVGCKYVVV